MSVVMIEQVLIKSLFYLVLHHGRGVERERSGSTVIPGWAWVTESANSDWSQVASRGSGHPLLKCPSDSGRPVISKKEFIRCLFLPLAPYFLPPTSALTSSSLLSVLRLIFLADSSSLNGSMSAPAAHLSTYIISPLTIAYSHLFHFPVPVLSVNIASLAQEVRVRG